MALIFEGLVLNPNLLKPARGEPCRLEECGGACCVGGIWLDVRHVETIFDHAELLKPWMAADRQNSETWFSDEVVEHADFPSGVGTATAIAPRLDGSGRVACIFALVDHTCALENASRQAGMPWPGLKPFDCATYPVLRSEGELRRDTESARRGADCQGPKPPKGAVQPPSAEQPAFFQVFRREVELSIGAAGYTVLQQAWEAQQRRRRR